MSDNSTFKSKRRRAIPAAARRHFTVRIVEKKLRRSKDPGQVQIVPLGLIFVGELGCFAKIDPFGLTGGTEK